MALPLVSPVYSLLPCAVQMMPSPLKFSKGHLQERKRREKKRKEKKSIYFCFFDRTFWFLTEKKRNQLYNRNIILSSSWSHIIFISTINFLIVQPSRSIKNQEERKTNLKKGSPNSRHPNKKTEPNSWG